MSTLPLCNVIIVSDVVLLDRWYSSRAYSCEDGALGMSAYPPRGGAEPTGRLAAPYWLLGLLADIPSSSQAGFAIVGFQLVFPWKLVMRPTSIKTKVNAKA